jgi:hypothetical protein
MIKYYKGTVADTCSIDATNEASVGVASKVPSRWRIFNFQTGFTIVPVTAQFVAGRSKSRPTLTLSLEAG